MEGVCVNPLRTLHLWQQALGVQQKLYPKPRVDYGIPHQIICISSLHLNKDIISTLEAEGHHAYSYIDNLFFFLFGMVTGELLLKRSQVCNHMIYKYDNNYISISMKQNKPHTEEAHHPQKLQLSSNNLHFLRTCQQSKLPFRTCSQ